MFVACVSVEVDFLPEGHVADGTEELANVHVNRVVSLQVAAGRGFV